MNDILTAQDLSEYLKITTTTIYKLAQQGKIPCFKIGSEWRFKKELIDKWLESGADNAPRKILVVDDEADICELFVRALSKRGFAVDTANTGQDGIRLATTQSYDLIFLDLKMPGMTGVETFKELKRLNVRSLTVIVTGYPDSDLLAETMKLGPLTIILKPFDLGEIQRAVEALVQMT
jgi:two-component system response regulator (stage 0 sporulation protein F)